MHALPVVWKKCRCWTTLRHRSQEPCIGTGNEANVQNAVTRRYSQCRSWKCCANVHGTAVRHCEQCCIPHLLPKLLRFGAEGSPVYQTWVSNWVRTCVRIMWSCRRCLVIVAPSRVDLQTMAVIQGIGKCQPALNDFWAIMNVPHKGLHHKRSKVIWKRH